MKDYKDQKGRDTPKLSKTAENLKRHKSPENARLHKTQENPRPRAGDGPKTGGAAKKGSDGGKPGKQTKSVETPRSEKSKGGDTPRKQKGGNIAKEKQTKTESSKDKSQPNSDRTRNRTPDRKRPGSGKRESGATKLINNVADEESNEPSSDLNNNMTLDDFHVVCQVGQGACGSVFLVRNLENKKVFALKKIQLDESRKTRTREAVLRESRILSGLKHPHIVTCQGSFFDPKKEYLCILQDYCDGGTLDDRIREVAMRRQYFHEKQVLHWFLQIAMAVRFMHTKRVLHRDLKASNVFMNKTGTCKIGDFGIAKSMNNTIEVASTCVGTPCYLSPEMCQDIPYSSKADVWALGCLLYEMLTLRPAFDANNLVSLFYKIVKGDYEPLPEFYSEDMLDLVRMILVKNPEERPSARAILATPFVRSELLKFIEEKEYLLEQSKTPMPKGSRPYSTPVLLGRSTAVSGDHMLVIDTQQQRAFSCRPIMCTKKEKTLLLSAKPGNRGLDGRVSVILEETEDQLLERSLRNDRSQSHPAIAEEGERRGSGQKPSTPSLLKPPTPNRKPGSSGKKGSASRRSGTGIRKPGTGTRKPGTPASRSNTDLTLGGDIDYYYDDDFDDDSSFGSDDDIPEELPGHQKHAGGYSFTQTFEIPEIPEELPDGLEADDDDDDDDYGDFEEPEEVQEEIEEIVNVAKEANEALDTKQVEVDETIVDEQNSSNSASTIIKEHCREALGEETYEQVKKYCQDNATEGQLQQLEEEVGKENLATFYLMAEVLNKSKDLQVTKKTATDM